MMEYLGVEHGVTQCVYRFNNTVKTNSRFVVPIVG